MIRARLLAASLLLALAAACGQKGDLRLPPAKTQPATPAATPQAAPASPAPPASK